MKTLFMSQDFWDLIEDGFTDVAELNAGEKRRLKEIIKKDSKSMFFIQQVIHKTIFSRILAATTSRYAWLILKTELQGSSKVITVKRQSLRRDFETLFMNNNESVQGFLSRVSGIRQLKNKHFQVKEENPIKNQKSLEQGTRGRGRGSFRGRGRGRGTSQSGYAEEEEEEEENVLFMAHSTTIDYKTDVWFVDSGCSHHMVGEIKGSKEFDETKKRRIWLGDNKEIQVKGEGTIAVQTRQDSCGPMNTKSLASSGFFLLLTDDYSWRRYYTESKDFRLYNPTNCIVIIRRDVVFDENIGWKWDRNLSNTTPSCSIPTLMVLDLEGSSEIPPQKFRSLSDIYETCSSYSLVCDFKSSMMRTIEMTYLEVLNYFLGLEVKKEEDGIFISQRKYATDLLKRFNMLNCKIVSTPTNVNEKLQLDNDSDWTGNVNDRKSISGNLFTLGSATITWNSKKQSTTTLSSSKAKYVVATSSTYQSSGSDGEIIFVSL
ncbi:uncharacterized protein [Solanum lycopersicum]|uniref:uncharacterized protein n=1 Tax=Solanum lycopersicum TaxID=4081 RepID=UPI00374923C1